MRKEGEKENEKRERMEVREIKKETERGRRKEQRRAKITEHRTDMFPDVSTDDLSSSKSLSTLKLRKFRVRKVT